MTFTKGLPEPGSVCYDGPNKKGNTMRENPYMAINLLTNETVGWYASPNAAHLAHPNEPIDVIYRPGRKKKAK